ncbi:MAG: hypothetical protein Q4Q07_02950 [Tissierellia bacterium]|nr:hypothetical protein [Tissierellia bacterium]
MDILLIEDDSTIGYVLDEYFQGKAKLHICTSLEETMDLDIKDFDFIILDINLGEDSGLEYLICKKFS